MAYYFDSKERQEELFRVLESWRVPKTPYRHWCGVKGKGADCLHFMVRVLEETKAIAPIKIPRYVNDWHEHNSEEVLLGVLRGHPKTVEVCKDDLVNGDVKVYHFGKVCSHVAIYFDGLVYQAVNGVGVRRIEWLDPMFHKRVRYAFRIVK